MGHTMNLHQSYSTADTEADRQRLDKDPLLHLNDIGFWDRNVTFGQASNLTRTGCDVLADKGNLIASAPVALTMCGHGGSVHGQPAELWRRCATIELGSDSANWSSGFDLRQQISRAKLEARGVYGVRHFLIAEGGLSMATGAGARAAGREDSFGRREADKCADIVINRLDRPEIAHSTDMIRNLDHAPRSRSVHMVVINGRIVLKAGRFPNRAERSTVVDIRAAAAGLFRQMGCMVKLNQLSPRTIR
jgi:cytosine/adenosine deaminase-related metal-dependent hydrolase